MDVKLLIDAIVRQTTVLIAQLSTSAGIRAPLAHVADQVFLDLASEIEAQGVSRKIAADMFGLALRSYQKKMQRLTESSTVRDRTLWEAVLAFIQDQGGATREKIFERFRRDPERDVAAVLNDLVAHGLVYSTGKGKTALYGLASEADRRRVALSDRADALQSMIWLSLYRRPSSRTELAAGLGLDSGTLDSALGALLESGRVREVDGQLRTDTFIVPVGAEQGWEAAVFDHFSAVASAIAAKVRRRAPRSEIADVVGGATLTFEISQGHPAEAAVLGLLQRTRREINELWASVEKQNEQHPIEDEAKVRVTFYFGQNVDGAGLDERVVEREEV